MDAKKGFSMTPKQLDFLEACIHQYSPANILEIGSGESTWRILSIVRNPKYNSCLTTIEHDSFYGVFNISTYGRNFAYVMTSLVARELETVAGMEWLVQYQYLPCNTYDFVLIDGPPKIFGRLGVFYQIQPFLLDNAIILIDDYDNPDIIGAVYQWKESFNLEFIEVFTDGDKRLAVFRYTR